MAYATKTSVSVDKSQADIRKTLSKYDANGFAYAENGDKAIVMFEMGGRRIKFTLPMPNKPKNPKSSELKKYEQLCRSRWRCLGLAIKAKLECVESGITTLEQEFLAHVMLPNGKTVGDEISPQIEHSYKSKKMPLLLGFSA